MNAKELAEILNGRQYRNEITKDEEALAKENGLVVVYGASDDLTEFKGAVNDEYDAYNGRDFLFTKQGLLLNECEDERCPYAARLAENAVLVSAIWDKEGYSWVFETSIPHATFEILEDDDKYCRGIVFELSDVVVN